MINLLFNDKKHLMKKKRARDKETLSDLQLG